MKEERSVRPGAIDSPGEQWAKGGGIGMDYNKIAATGPIQEDPTVWVVKKIHTLSGVWDVEVFAEQEEAERHAHASSHLAEWAAFVVPRPIRAK